MACNGTIADYLCAGWRARAAVIVARDGGRCRGCDRSAEVARLEVHHRRYGAPGPCGACRLTGVQDDDLLTLCTDCHDAITAARRTLRFAAVNHTPSLSHSPAWPGEAWRTTDV